ncbi:MAG TPA: hypothetical protein VGK27_02485 [Candidatus Deferrimicrobiaceae bacterium]|jgi:hypothetical protein
MGWCRGVILILLLLSASSGWAFADEYDFAFVFQCNVKKSQLCLTAKYPSGQKFHLLGTKSNVCVGETGGTINFQQRMREKVISKIDTSRCPNRSSYFLACGAESPKRFSRYAPTRVTDPNVIEKVDNAIKLLKFYSTANEYFGNTLSSKPTVFYPIPSNDNLIIAQYTTGKPKDGNDKYGPVYISINGEIREIASEATLGNLFTMNDRHYMTYRSGCWQGCGILAEVLVEISDEGIRKILIDGFFGV